MSQSARRIRSAPVVAVGIVVLLVAATRGTAYAAKKITGKDIKNSSITGKDIKNKSLTGSDIKDSSLTGSDVKDSSLTGNDVKNGSLTAADVKAGTFAPAAALGGATIQKFSKRIPVSTPTAVIATYADVELRASCTGAGDVTLNAAKKAGGPSYAYGLTRVNLATGAVAAFTTGNFGNISLLPAGGTDAQTTAFFTSTTGKVVNLSVLARGTTNFSPAVNECLVAGTVIVG
jgi:hypothetical protein